MQHTSSLASKLRSIGKDESLVVFSNTEDGDYKVLQRSIGVLKMRHRKVKEIESFNNKVFVLVPNGHMQIGVMVTVTKPSTAKHNFSTCKKFSVIHKLLTMARGDQLVLVGLPFTKTRVLIKKAIKDMYLTDDYVIGPADVIVPATDDYIHGINVRRKNA